MQTDNAQKIFIAGQLQRAQDNVDQLIASGVQSVVLDFSACTFISVDGLEWLEEMLLRADSSKAQVRFVSIPPSIYKVFKVARIDSIMRACGAPNTDKHSQSC